VVSVVSFVVVVTASAKELPLLSDATPPAVVVGCVIGSDVLGSHSMALALLFIPAPTPPALPSFIPSDAGEEEEGEFSISRALSVIVDVDQMESVEESWA